jgi:hypothetical protein
MKNGKRAAAEQIAETSFSRRDTRLECKRSREFLDRIRRYLLSRGFKDRDLKTGSRKS